METNFVPSKYQQKIFDTITNDTVNIVCEAVAGSGKSSTIITATNLIPKNKTQLFLAFNKSIVEELKLKMGNNNPNLDIRTLHSLGMSALLKVYKFTVNESKYRTYVNDMVKYGSIRPTIDLDESELQSYKGNILKLVDLFRVNLCKSLQDISDVADKYELTLLDNECEVTMQVVNWGKNNISQIDFTDMVYLPIIKNIQMNQFDFVFIDECQDLNACQRELFLKVIKPNVGRFIAVGDSRQAIYGFSGADVESFRILQSLPNTVTLPLSICYRCGSNIIELAKSIVPQIEPKPDAHLGLVKYDCTLDEINDNDLVLCRNNAPLVGLCMHLIGKGTKAYVKGRDIGQNLINMIRKTNSIKIIDAIDKINKEGEKIINKIVRKTHCTPSEARTNATFTNFLDKLNAIERLSENLTTSDSVVKRIESIFKDNDRQGICLSSVHKAKGLESNRCFIIREDKFYSKYAMKIPWMAEQESNLVYVAYTRGKHLLGFVAKKELQFLEEEN